ncbi:hypothetical protein N2152v2_006026 [Parachlorella kessleri]
MGKRTASWAVLLLALNIVSAADEAGNGVALGAMPVELGSKNFTDFLNGLPETRWVLMEWYAHWCGACRLFQPAYEKIADYFHKRGELQPKIVVARVDCPNEEELCKKFHIRSYPTVRLGLAPIFASYSLEGVANYSGRDRTMEAVVDFVGKHLDVKFDLSQFDAAASTDSATVQTHSHGGLRNEPPHADLKDIEGATVKSWQYILGTPSLLEGLESRQALLDWLELLAAYHPVPRCKTGAESLVQRLDSLWPTVDDRPSSGLFTEALCPGSQFQDWGSCKGSEPSKRGYTCGLWMLLHSLAARLPEGEGPSGSPGAAAWVTTVKGFIRHFFQCSDCSTHFVRYASSEEALAVNGRLAASERKDPGMADKQWPHVAWPTQQQCPACRKSDTLSGPNSDIPDWLEEEVYKYLTGFYSGGGQSGELGMRGMLRQRTKGASWPEAALVCGVVGAVVFLVLRGSHNYRLRKSESRLL